MANLEKGWIHLHRQILNWEWYQDSNTFRLFIHLLLTANYENKKWQGKEIKKGQLITSYQHLSEELNLSVHQIRTSMNKLKTTGEITTKVTNKFTLVTIVKYSDYQDTQQESGKQNDKQEPSRMASKWQQRKKKRKKEYKKYILPKKKFEIRTKKLQRG